MYHLALGPARKRAISTNSIGKRPGQRRYDRVAGVGDGGHAVGMSAENTPPPGCSNRAATPSSESVQRLVDAVARLDADGPWIVDVLTEHMMAIRPVDRSTGQEERRSVLIASGAFSEEALNEAQASVERGSLILASAESWLAAARRTSSLDRTKRFLAIDDDTLVKRIENRELVAVKLADRLRFPH